MLLSEVGFELKAGQALGVIGPSGGGKTTLVRALTGIWPSLRGSVRLDDAELTQWPDDVLGQYIGYLPQDVALLDATIEENISRLEPHADARAIVEAAKGGRHPRDDRAAARWLSDPAWPARRFALGRPAPAHRPGAGALRQPFRRRHGRAQLESRRRR